MAGQVGLRSRYLEEIAEGLPHDEAHSGIAGCVARLVERYLEAAETVIVLQGSPGTGKTRLIRGILGALSRRNRGGAQVAYTGDSRALETDQIFVQFLVDDCNVFVVEDTDHLMRPHARGNDHLHRFLSVADGIVSAERRKIIFSTNLSNVGDLDDALIRHGRCFAHLHLRKMHLPEAEAMLRVLCGDKPKRLGAARRRLQAVQCKTYSLATVNKAVAETNADRCALDCSPMNS